jgi:hypothetical protein
LDYPESMSRTPAEASQTNLTILQAGGKTNQSRTREQVSRNDVTKVKEAYKCTKACLLRRRIKEFLIGCPFGGEFFHELFLRDQAFLVIDTT